MRNAERFDSSDEGSNLRVSLFEDLHITSLGTDFEELAHSEGYAFIAGIDEVGRGCIAGPVVAGACILDLTKPLPEGLNDSKKLTAKQRYEIATELKETAVAYSIGRVDAEETVHR